MLAKVQYLVDGGLFVLIWLVQLIIYPAFRDIREQVFTAWHNSYSKLMGAIVGPLLLAQASVEIIRATQQQASWLRIALIALVWMSTLFLSVPCHRHLQSAGKNVEIIKRLIQTNWIRTMIWTTLFLDSLIT